jgi:hypothetical protein
VIASKSIFRHILVVFVLFLSTSKNFVSIICFRQNNEECGCWKEIKFIVIKVKAKYLSGQKSPVDGQGDAGDHGGLVAQE